MKYGLKTSINAHLPNLPNKQKEFRAQDEEKGSENNFLLSRVSTGKCFREARKLKKEE